MENRLRILAGMILFIVAGLWLTSCEKDWGSTTGSNTRKPPTIEKEITYETSVAIKLNSEIVPFSNNLKSTTIQNTGIGDFEQKYAEHKLVVRLGGTVIKTVDPIVDASNIKLWLKAGNYSFTVEPSNNIVIDNLQGYDVCYLKTTLSNVTIPAQGSKIDINVVNDFSVVILDNGGDLTQADMTPVIMTANLPQTGGYLLEGWNQLTYTDFLNRIVSKTALTDRIVYTDMFYDTNAQVWYAYVKPGISMTTDIYNERAGQISYLGFSGTESTNAPFIWLRNYLLVANQADAFTANTILKLTAGQSGITVKYTDFFNRTIETGTTDTWW